MAITDPLLSPQDTPIMPMPSGLLDDARDPYSMSEENKAAVLKLIREKESEWSPGREAFVRASWRNLLFERGHQDIVFSRATNSWRPVVMRGPRIIPTNRF